MADNTQLNAGSGGDTVRDIDRSSVKTQIIGLDLTPAGGSETLMNGTMPVSAASLPLPTGASTSAKQDTGNTSLSSIDGKITAVNTGAVVVSSSALPTGAATSAKQDTGNTSVGNIDTTTAAGNVLTGAVNETAPATDTASSGLNGRLQRIAQRLTTLIGSTLAISAASLPLPTGASTAAKQPALGTAGTPSADVISIQGVASMTAVQTGGNIAHDGVDAGNPHKMGGRAIAHGANPTAVSAADRTDWYFNRAGVPYVLGGHPNIITVEAAYTAAQTDTAIVTVASGLKIVVTEIDALCDNANTVDVGLRVGFGTANTPTTTGVVLTHPGIAAGSGFVRGSGTGILGVGADNEDLRITSEVPTTGSLRVLVSYFTIES